MGSEPERRGGGAGRPSCGWRPGIGILGAGHLWANARERGGSACMLSARNISTEYVGMSGMEIESSY
jgi:hypothetical protein